MNTPLLQNKVSKANAAIRQLAWCDFEIVDFGRTKLRLQGSLSTSYPFDIQITFEDVFFIQCSTSWKTDTSKDVLVLINGDEAVDLNLKYQVETGYSIFRIFPEDLETTFYVVARDLHYETRSKP